MLSTEPTSENQLILRLISPPPQISVSYGDLEYLYKIYDYIDAYGPISLEDIADEFGVTKESLRYAIRILYRHGLIKRTPNLAKDMRSNLYASKEESL